MADPIASVETILQIAKAISDAVGTARRNIDECRDVRTQVAIESGSLRLLQEKGLTVDRGSAVSCALGHLDRTLRHALELVRACREEQGFVQLVLNAEDMSNKLRQVKEDILQKLSLATFAINAHMMAPNANHAAGQHHQDGRHEKVEHSRRPPHTPAPKTPLEHRRRPATPAPQMPKAKQEHHHRPDTREHRHGKAPEHHHKHVTQEDHPRTQTPAQQRPKAQHEHQKPTTREHPHASSTSEQKTRHGTNGQNQRLENREEHRPKTPDHHRGPTREHRGGGGSQTHAHQRPKMGENQGSKMPAHHTHKKGEHPRPKTPAHRV
ncbi:hypothetical protein BS78_K260100 [Paspalum vaginatum]|uniref:Uncharacterized protein n=1 Tax=Paspalum vaginatum TaxID=158149 RepID=A0A9W7XD50_9POAL|nr:hypothetical protein BS78_K260100 [Paspalum vaginatum]KAJ1256940.1 hypothetical protein BS78_K260100 [Paspalum vaginatum]